MSILNNPYRGDYDHVPEVDRKGRFRDRFFYNGDLYVLPYDETEKKKTYLPCFSFGAGMFACLVVQGLVNQTSSRTLWVVLPYFLQFLPVLFFLMGIVEYALAAPKMTRQQYDKGVGRMHFNGIAVIVLAAISIISDVIYLVLRRGRYDMGREFFYLFLHVPVIMIAVLFSRYYNKKFSGISVETTQ